MNARVPTVIAALLLALPAAAQPVLYGVRANGDLLWINSRSGGSQLIGSSGVPCAAAAAHTFYGGRSGNIDVLFTAGGTQPDQVSQVSRWSGVLLTTQSLSGRPPGYSVHALAEQPPFGSVLYSLLRSADPSATDLLMTVSNGSLQGVGDTGRHDLEALAVSTTGTLYAIGSQNGGQLYSLDSTTGAPTLIGGSLPNVRGLSFVPDGRLLACGKTSPKWTPSPARPRYWAPQASATSRGSVPSPSAIWIVRAAAPHPSSMSSTSRAS